MKSLGEILAANSPATSAVPASAFPPEPRKHRVTLCVHIFASVEVTATTIHEAFQRAESLADTATRTFKSEPHAVRAEILQMVDPRDPAKGYKWVDAIEAGQ